MHSYLATVAGSAREYTPTLEALLLQLHGRRTAQRSASCTWWMIEAEHELFRVGAAAGGWPACARACAQFWCPPSACMRQDDHEQLCRSAHHFFSGYYCLLAWLLLFPVELRFGSVCFYATILFACFIFPILPIILHSNLLWLAFVSSSLPTVLFH